MITIQSLESNWDLIVIGGGITGAGILREASRSGLKTLLLEQNDFAWGTSSRSSKLVHGGLRYLKEGRLPLTIESVRERERLLNEAPFLVEPIDFLFPTFKGKSPGKLSLEAGLSIYDLIAFKKRHTFLSAEEFLKVEPKINPDKFMGGFRFMDAQVDDARLVLRVIKEAEKTGAKALNYAAVKKIIRNNSGNVTGVLAVDSETGESRELLTPAVINATGSWAEQLHPSPKKGLHLRPLRGSHIFFTKEKLPVSQAISLVHPSDKRPVFIVPWEGASLVGTTDLDHENDLSREPSITKEEVSYLIEAVHGVFPDVKLSEKDCLSTMAGIRPVLSEGIKDPSKESREHVVWVDKGLVTITGGKLTTFRILAWDALKAVKPFLSGKQLKGCGDRVFEPLAENRKPLSRPDIIFQNRLYGRYGEMAENLMKKAPSDQLDRIPGTLSLWAELSFAAQHEKIRHLPDLLLRRVRIGLLLPEGGKKYLDRIKDIVMPHLSWDNDTWEKEKIRYLENIRANYSVP
ncbi:MAG: glycerol-3-phosphate dehydrogenase/oxidase [Proteobacteria bacterium]|nr:glycerol-3-phosphate dehydrogenase/oxidase [Pseudomonadota bacterium]